MKAIVADQYDYIIPQSSVSFTLNALGDPDNIDVTVLAGTKITAYRSGIEKLVFLPSGEYRQWNLAGYPTHFTDTTGKERYCHVAVERNGVNAFFVFPDILIDLYGRRVIPFAHGQYQFVDAENRPLGTDDRSLPEQRELRNNGEYFFFYIGQISASGSPTKTERHWEENPRFGLLDTAAHRQRLSDEGSIILVPTPTAVNFAALKDMDPIPATVTVKVSRSGVLGTPEGEPVPQGYRVAGSTEAPVTEMPEESCTEFSVLPTDHYLYLSLFREDDEALVHSVSVAVIKDGVIGADGKTYVIKKRTSMYALTDIKGEIPAQSEFSEKADMPTKDLRYQYMYERVIYEDTDGNVVELGTAADAQIDKEYIPRTENFGEWEVSKCPIPYLGIVRLGTATFQCVNPEGADEDHPPLAIYKDVDGNYLQFNDGGYVLAETVDTYYGETAYWRMLTIDGNEGSSNYVFDLSNEMVAVQVDKDGKAILAQTFKTKPRVFYGSKDVTEAFEITSEFGTANLDGSFDIPISIGQKIGESLDVIFTAMCSKPTPIIMQATMTIAGVNGGVIYDIVPSLDDVSFQRDKAGHFLPESQTITFRVRKTEGTSIEVIDIPGDLFLAVSNTAMPTSKPDASTTSINVLPEDRYIYAALFDNNGKLIDKESIPVVRDGSKGEKGGIFVPTWKGKKLEFTYKDTADPSELPDPMDLTPESAPYLVRVDKYFAYNNSTTEAPKLTSNYSMIAKMPTTTDEAIEWAYDVSVYDKGNPVGSPANAYINHDYRLELAAIADAVAKTNAADEAAKNAGTAALNAAAKATDAETAAGNANTAANNANSAANGASSAAEKAGRVNATLNGTTLSVTDRNGKVVSVDIKGEKGGIYVPTWKGKKLEFTYKDTADPSELPDPMDLTPESAPYVVRVDKYFAYNNSTTEAPKLVDDYSLLAKMPDKTTPIEWAYDVSVYDKGNPVGSPANAYINHDYRLELAAIADAVVKTNAADEAATNAGTAALNANAKAEEAGSAATNANTAANNANSAANGASSAAEKAGRVNATISGTTLSVTDRNGNVVSVDTKGEKGDATVFLGFDLNTAYIKSTAVKNAAFTAVCDQTIVIRHISRSGYEIISPDMSNIRVKSGCMVGYTGENVTIFIPKGTTFSLLAQEIAFGLFGCTLSAVVNGRTVTANYTLGYMTDTSWMISSETVWKDLDDIIKGGGTLDLGPATFSSDGISVKNKTTGKSTKMLPTGFEQCGMNASGYEVCELVGSSSTDDRPTSPGIGSVQSLDNNSGLSAYSLDEPTAEERIAQLEQRIAQLEELLNNK